MPLGASGHHQFTSQVWDHSDNTVWYDFLAFSRLNHFLARRGYPVVRRMQKRFGRESAQAMLKAVPSDAVASDSPLI
jgi:hypothetical protein